MSRKPAPKPRLIRGALVDFAADPMHAADPASCLRFDREGALVVDAEGRIAWRGAFADLPPIHQKLAVEDFGEALVLSGFVDAHIHFPQYRMLAAPGRDLLDWLNRFAFPEEARYAAKAHAADAAKIFLDRLATHGTTAACAFSTSHRTATATLFAAAEKRSMALITGKTLMDRNAPEELRDDPETGAADCEALIQAWHGKGRLRYAISPRFAVTSSEAQLRLAGELLRRHPGCLLQTHLSESASEIVKVASLFPRAKDYTDIYERFGLLTSRSLLAHGIHLTERECGRLAETGARVVHCPTSNTFLGSGLFDIGHLGAAKRPVGVGLGSDVGGGLSYSMLATIGEAHKVAMLKGRSFGPLAGFHMATLGNAALLGLAEEIGSLDPGKWADLVVLDPLATPVMAARHELSESVEDTLFALMMLGDDRTVRATYIAGKRVHGAKP